MSWRPPLCCNLPLTLGQYGSGGSVDGAGLQLGDALAQSSTGLLSTRMS
ncbi:hypothetical protein GZS05_06565 [Klebsiella variicola]|nr:hypothetical protein GZS05_06565 [Klebsiella variicola]